MGLEVGGYHDRPYWPKLGTSLLISSCLILAIRTAKWAAGHDQKLSNHDLNREIDYSIALANSVLSRLLYTKEAIFPQGKEPWYEGMKTFPNDGKKQKGGFSFESPPFANRFLEDLFQRTDYGNAIPESFGFHEQARGSILSRCYIRCKSLLIAFPRLVAEPLKGLCRLSSLEDCSSVSKNNSTDE